MGGGNWMKRGDGKLVRTPNLTPHVTDIQEWTEKDLKQVLTEGISRNNTFVAFPRPRYPQLNNQEIKALYAYLQSIPPIENKIRRKAVSGSSAKKLYKAYQCSSCHGNTGEKPFDLTRAHQKYTLEEIEAYIANLRMFGNQTMPPFGDRISRKEYQLLAAYVVALGKQKRRK